MEAWGPDDRPRSRQYLTGPLGTILCTKEEDCLEIIKKITVKLLIRKSVKAVEVKIGWDSLHRWDYS